jgi:hypothetical protein
LKAALKGADREAGVCGKFCRSDATTDGSAYLVYHNGLGSSDSDEQIIHNTLVLAFSEEALRDRLALWLGDVHKRTKHDLNGVA